MTARAFTDLVLRYFTDHAIDPYVALRVGVTERREGEVVYPCVDARGEPSPRIRTLNGNGPKLQAKPGCKLALWWLTGKPTGGRVLITEGESDALAALSALHPSSVKELRELSVAAMPGASYPATRLLEELILAQVEEVLLALDNDAGGQEAQQEIVTGAARLGITPRVVPLPEGSDLADHLARSAQPDELLTSSLLTALNSDVESLPPPPLVDAELERSLLSIAGSMKRQNASNGTIAAALQAENADAAVPLASAVVQRLCEVAVSWQTSPLWVRDPQRFTEDERLSGDARHALLVLTLHASVAGERTIGVRRLGTIMGVGKNRAGRAILELRKHGRIIALPRATWKETTTYVIQDWSPPTDLLVPPPGTEVPLTATEAANTPTLSPKSKGTSVPPAGTREQAA